MMLQKRFFITGSPGTGKSRLIREGVTYASQKGLKVIGFYTPEIRDINGLRIGFDFEVIEYGKVPLARKKERWPIKFGSYSINPEAEKVYDIILTKLKESYKEDIILVLDEIGPMELKLKNGHMFFLTLLTQRELPIMGVYHKRLQYIDYEIYSEVKGGLTFDLDKARWDKVLLHLKKWIDSVKCDL